MEKKSAEFSQAKSVNVWVNKAPILSPIEGHFCAGTTLRAIFESYSGLAEQFTNIRVNGDWTQDWSYQTKPDDIIHIIQVPREPATIAWIAVTVSVLSAVAGYLLYAPPEGPTEDEKTNRINGPRNEAKRYDPVPVVLGDRKTTPPYAANPYTDWTGNQEYLNMLLCVGQGPLDVRDLKIGDTNVDDYEEVEYSIVDQYNSTDYSELLEVWRDGVTQENINTTTTYDNFITRTSAANPVRLSVDIAWDGGLRGQSGHRGDAIEIQYEINGKWYIIARPSTSQSYHLTGSLYRSGGNFYVIRPGGSPFDGYRPVFNNVLEEVTSSVAYYDSATNIALIDASTVGVRVNSISAWERTTSFFVRGLSWKPVDTSGNRLAGNVSVRVRKAIDEDIGSSADRKAASWLNLKTTSEYNSSDFFETIGSASDNDFYPALIALRIRATEQFSGVIDNLNCQVTSVVPVDWNLDWSEINPTTTAMKPSENPAELFRWVLQGNSNSIRTPNSKIDIDALEVWRDRCVSEGWKASEYVNYEATLKKTLNDIAFTGRAEFSYRDGKFSIVEKIRRTIPKQIFTPKNSSNLKSRREFPEDYDGIKYKFQNSTREDQVDEGTYYDPFKFRDNDPEKPLPGVTPSGIFRTAEFWGVTDADLARRHARFLFFEEKLRRESFELETDLEGLVAGRGDMVRIAHDVIDIGVGQGFITQDVAADTTFFLDERKDVVVGDTYFFQVRSVNSGIVFEEFSAQYQGGGEWLASTPLTLSRGDLAVYGEQGRVSLDAIIVSVENQSDYGARLTLVNAAPQIFDEDAVELPRFNTGLTPRKDFRTPDVPVVNLSDSGYSYDQGLIKVAVEKGTDEIQDITLFALQYRSGDQGVVETVDVDDTVWVSAGVVSAADGVFEIPADKIQGVSYWLRVKAYSSNKLSSPWSEEQQLLIEADPSPDVTSFTISEQVNEPKTPDGMFSTLVIQAEEPEDPAYLYAIVEYKLPDQDEWQTISRLGWKYPSQAEVQVLANGLQYQIRVRTVNTFNVVNQNGLTQLFTTTNVLDPEYTEDNPYEVLPVPNVTGLEIFEQGNDTEFGGKDAKFVWRKSSVGDWVELGYEGLRGAGAGRHDQYFRDYQVEIYANNNLVRTEFVVDALYIYTFEKNAEDYEREEGVVGAYRDFQVRVYERGRNNQISEVPAVLDVSNTAPKALQNLRVSPGFNVIEIAYDRPQDLDFAGVDIWIETTSGFDPDNTTPVATISDNSFVASGLAQDTNYYVRVRPFDDFGKTGTNTSSEFNIKTKAGTDLTGLSGWAYEIDPVNRTFIQNNVEGGAIDLGDPIVGGQLGTDKLANLAVEASKLASSSVTSTKIANLAVGTAAIGTAAVTNAKIENLAVDNAKIANAAITNVKIKDAEISSAKIVDLTASKLTAGTINATGGITTETIFRAVDDINTPTVQVGMGPATFGGATTYLLWAYNGTDFTFGVDELGNAYFSGELEASSFTNNNLTIDASGNLDSTGTFRFGGATTDYIDFDGTNLLIETDNFSVDAAGNATFSGELNAASGTLGDDTTDQYVRYTGSILEIGPGVTIGSNEDRTVTVGTGGDFATINGALEELSRVVPAYKSGGFNAIITLLTGFVIAEQIYVNGVDLSWITINSESGEVHQIDETAMTENVALVGTARPAFTCVGGGRSPRIDFRMGYPTGVSEEGAIYCRGEGSIITANQIYVENARFPSIYVSQGGSIFCDGDVENYGSNFAEGIIVETNASLEVTGSVTSNGNSEAGLLISSNARVSVTEDINCNNNVGEGIRMQAMASLLCGVEITCTGNGLRALFMTGNSTIRASSLITTGNGSGPFMNDSSEVYTSFQWDASNTGGVYMQRSCTARVGSNLNCGPDDLTMIDGCFVSRSSGSTGGVINVTPNTIGGDGILLEFNPGAPG